MTWINKTLLVIAVVAMLGTYFIGKWGAQQNSRRMRLESNQSALLEKHREYVVRDSLSALSIGVLTLQTGEFKEHFEELNSLVRDMGMRLRRIENVSQSATESVYEISASVCDTVVIFDTLPSIAAQALMYKNPWIELDGMIFGGTFNGSVVTYDTLTQVVHRIPRRFLFIRYGTKELRQEIVSSNPHTRITYSHNIRIER